MTNELTLENIRSGAFPSDAHAVGFLLGEIEKLNRKCSALAYLQYGSAGPDDPWQGKLDEVTKPLHADIEHLTLALVQQEGTLNECEALLRETISEDGVYADFDSRLAAYWEKSKALADWRTRDMLIAQRPTIEPGEQRYSAEDYERVIAAGGNMWSTLERLREMAMENHGHNSKGAEAFRAFADEHARLMRIRASAPQAASRDASTADLLGALQDVVHTDPGPVRAAQAVRDASSGEKP